MMGRKLNLSNLFYFILLCSNFVSNSFALMIFLSFIIFTFATEKKMIFYYLKSKFFSLLLIFFVLISLNSFFINQKIFINSLIFFIYYFGFLSILIKYKNFNINNFYSNKWIFVFFLFISLNVLMQFLFGFDLFNHVSTIDSGRRLTAITGKPNIGRLIFVFFLPIISFCIYNLKKNFYYLFFVCIYFFLILITGERIVAGFSFICLFLISLFSIYKNLDFSFKNLKYFFSLIFFSLIFFFLILKFNDFCYERFILTVNQLLTFKDTAYGMIFKTSYNIIIDNLFFGIGIGNYRNVCSYYMDPNLSNFLISHGCGYHPHNLYLQIFAELGFFTFLLLFYFFIKYLRFTVKNFNNIIKNPIYFAMHLICIYILMPINISESFIFSFNFISPIILFMPILIKFDENK